MTQQAQGHASGGDGKMSEAYKCPRCHDAGFYMTTDEEGREVAVTCGCHPAVKAHRVKDGAGKYSWMAFTKRQRADEYTARG